VSAILLVIDNLEFGGGERGMLQLAEGLARDGWRVAAAGQPGGPFEAGVRAAGGEFVALDMRSRLPLGAVRTLRAAVGGRRFDLVHSQGARADFAARLALAGVPGVALVCTVQMPVEGFDVPGWRRALYLALDRASARRVDRFIVVSRALWRTLVEGRRVPASRVRLVHNGVETAALASVDRKRAAAALRRELGLEAGAALVGAAGRLVWQKGFPHLIEAMRQVVARAPQARLLIAGEGPQRAELESLARAAGLGGRARFLGFRGDVPEFLAALDVLVVPSVREGFPMITLEAMALGTPIVATAIDGTIEQLRHGVEALLVPPGDPGAIAAAVTRVLHDRALAARLAAAARSRAAAEFDVGRTLDLTRAVYAELLGAARGAAR